MEPVVYGSIFYVWHRGAELINELRKKRIQEQEHHERRILEKIRVKMERIKATQQKIQGPVFKEPESHHAGKSTWIYGTITAVIILLLLNKMDLCD
jgi:hypothetical protein